MLDNHCQLIAPWICGVIRLAHVVSVRRYLIFVGNVLVISAIEQRERTVRRKDLDRINGPALYKTIRAQAAPRKQMLMNWTYNEHSPKQRSFAAMYGVVFGLGLNLSAGNTYNGRLGRETSIDSRHIRH